MAFIGADEPMEHSMQKLNGLSRSLTPLKPDGTLIAVIEMSPNDGVSDNLSWNCGAEGETSDTRIGILRERQIRNFLTILMLSRGVPMVLAGDEARRTQKGNNNAYCQDNEISWFDWKAPEKHAGMLRFWHLMIGFRKTHVAVRKNSFFTGETNARFKK
jgi:glycogen operon protein